MRAKLLRSLLPGLAVALVVASANADDEPADCWVWCDTPELYTIAPDCIPYCTGQGTGASGTGGGSSGTSPWTSLKFEVQPEDVANYKIFYPTDTAQTTYGLPGTAEWSSLDHPCKDLYSQLALYALADQSQSTPIHRTASRLNVQLVALENHPKRCNVYVHGMNESVNKPLLYAAESGGVKELIVAPKKAGPKDALYRDGINVYLSWHTWHFEQTNADALNEVNDLFVSTLADGLNGRICDGLPAGGCRNFDTSLAPEPAFQIFSAVAEELRQRREDIRIYFHSRGTIYGIAYGLFSWPGEEYDAWYLGGGCPARNGVPTDHCLWGQFDPIPGVIAAASIAKLVGFMSLGWTHFPWQPIQSDGVMAAQKSAMRLLQSNAVQTCHGQTFADPSGYFVEPTCANAPPYLQTPPAARYYADPHLGPTLDNIVICLATKAPAACFVVSTLMQGNYDFNSLRIFQTGSAWENQFPAQSRFAKLGYWDMDGNGFGHEPAKYACAAETSLVGMPKGKLALTGEGSCFLGAEIDADAFAALLKIPPQPKPLGLMP